MMKFWEIIFDFQVSSTSALKCGLCKALIKDLDKLERNVKSYISRTQSEGGNHHEDIFPQVNQISHQFPKRY